MASYSARSFNSPLLFKGSLVNPRLHVSNEHVPIVRVPRAGERPGCPFYLSEAVRCASTEDHQAPSPLIPPRSHASHRRVACLVSHCACRTINIIIPSSLVFPLLEGHSCWSKCGRRTRPFSGRAFREHRTNVGVLPPFSPLTDPSPPGYDLRYLIRS